MSNYSSSKIPCGIDQKYLQNSEWEKGTHPHWEGKPAGSSWEKDTCWLCAKGCAVLSYLYWKKLEPDQSTVEGCINENADFVWSRKGLVRSETIVAPSIGKLASRQHFVHIISEVGDGRFNIFDPHTSSEIIYQKYPSEFSCCYKENT